MPIIGGGPRFGGLGEFFTWFFPFGPWPCSRSNYVVKTTISKRLHNVVTAPGHLYPWPGSLKTLPWFPFFKEACEIALKRFEDADDALVPLAHDEFLPKNRWWKGVLFRKSRNPKWLNNSGSWVGWCFFMNFDLSRLFGKVRGRSQVIISRQS